MTGRDRLIAALGAARDLTDGPGKVAVLEQLSAEADAIGDLRLGFEARLELMDAYDEVRQRWRILPAFTWCRAAVDREPERFDDAERGLLRWYQRWAVGAFLGWSAVDLAATGALLDDLERRAGAADAGLRAVLRLRCAVADHLGDEAAARDRLVRWEAADAGDEADGCLGCDLARRADLLAGWGEWQAAVDTAGPVIRGLVACDRPERALTAAMIPYLRLGRITDASSAHLRAYPRHRAARDGFAYVPDHLIFCAIAGHPGRGLDLLAAHLPELEAPPDDHSAMRFAAAGALVCRLAAEAGLGTRRVRPDVEDTAAELGGRLAALAADLAAQFDARNGTGHQSAVVAALMRAVPERIAAPAFDDGGADGGLAPLSLEAVTAVLDARGARYAVEDDGAVAGRFGAAHIRFLRIGAQREVLRARVVAERRLPAERLAEAYRFCNAWNADRLAPAAYVRDGGDGLLELTGDLTTDLDRGVTRAQLGVLLDAAIASGATFAAAVADLP